MRMHFYTNYNGNKRYIIEIILDNSNQNHLFDPKYLSQLVDFSAGFNTPATVNITRNKDSDNSDDDNLSLLTFYPSHIFINDNSHWNYNSIKTLGHTMLFKICTTSEPYYIYVSNYQIYSFHPLVAIVGFNANMGPNDVPYPYAWDSLGNVYNLNEQEVLTNYDFSRFTKFNPEPWLDIPNLFQWLLDHDQSYPLGKQLKPPYSTHNLKVKSLL